MTNSSGTLNKQPDVNIYAFYISGAFSYAFPFSFLPFSYNSTNSQKKERKKKEKNKASTQSRNCKHAQRIVHQTPRWCVSATGPCHCIADIHVKWGSHVTTLCGGPWWWSVMVVTSLSLAELMHRDDSVARLETEIGTSPSSDQDGI